MEDAISLKERIKTLMVENLMLQTSAAEIADDLPLFGPGSLGLDSVDALQIVVALDKNFGLKIPDPAAAKQILQSVNSITDAVQQKLASPRGGYFDSEARNEGLLRERERPLVENAVLARAFLRAGKRKQGGLLEHETLLWGLWS